jgi:hypothetical protein
MAVAFDAKATAVTSQVAYSSPVTNANLTIAAGTLVIGIFACTDNTTLAVPTAMTWNGVTMTPFANITQSNGFGAVYGFALVSPATGNHTLSCTYTNGTGGGPGIYLDCFSFSGTNITSVANCIPGANIITNATNASATAYPSAAISVTTAAGDAACAAAYSGFANINAASVGTAINITGAGTGNYGSLYNLAVGASTNEQFGSGGGANPAAGIFFRIAQPSAGVPGIVGARLVMM